MNKANVKYFNLTIDKLGDLLAAEKISYDIFVELAGLMYWALDQQNKEVAEPFGKISSSRALNSRYIDNVLEGYKLSFRLKEFIDSMLTIPFGLLVHRINYIKKKIWRLRSRKNETEFLRILMNRINNVETETLEVMNLLDQYSGCEDDNDIERMLNDLPGKEGE